MYVCARACVCMHLIVDTHIAEKKANAKLFNFANRKRESDVLLNHIHETWNAEDRPTVITPKNLLAAYHLKRKA